MLLTQNDILNAEKELCKRSLAYFAKSVWHILEPGTPLKWGWVLDVVCAHLEAVTRGEVIRLLINVPPGSMKSLLTSVIWPAWEWGPKGLPHHRFMGTAHAQHLAVRDNMKCRRLIQSEWYQKRWPVELVGDQNAKTKFENTASGFREAMSFTGLTGSRGDRVILDDPHSVDDANSATKLKSDIVTFREALPSRVNNELSAIIIIMQRLHSEDVSAMALSLGYKHLCVPMRYEGKKQISTLFSDRLDPREQDGELMFPERFSEEQVRELEQSLGEYATAGQLQQRPAPRGGGIFKETWWQYYTVPPRIKYRTIYADTAQKTKEQNDYSVFQSWGMGFDGRIYLLDMIRGKWEAPELLVQAKAFWNKNKAIAGQGMLRAIKIEDKSSGTGLIQQLRKERIPVDGIPRGTDKVSRALDVTPQVQAGNVVLPENASYLSDILSEASGFPNAPHDDTLDPLMDAISDMLISGGAYDFETMTKT